MIFLKRQSGSCVTVNGGTEISQISSKRSVPEMVKSLTGLGRHEGE